MMANKTLLSIAIAGALASTASSYGFAQEAESKANVSNEAEQGAFVLEKIQVTAQRRTENLQETPIAITAFSQNALNDIGATNLQDLVEAVPTIHTSRTNNGAVQITLRGITSTNNTELGDPAVSFNIDGIYMARPQAASALMFDMEGIEVLRGPQGTLFGRNSPAGAINIKSARPGQDLEGSIALAAANYDRRLVQGYINVPVNDDFALRFAGMHDSRNSFNEVGETPDGVTIGSDEIYDTVDDTAGRVSALWTPNENLTWLVTYDYLDSAGLPQASQAIGDEPRILDLNRPSTFQMDTSSLRSKLDWDFSSTIGLSYLSSYNTLDTNRISSGDLGGGDQYANRENTSFTHELQIKSIEEGAKFDWIAGIFYYEEENNTDFQVKSSPNAGIRFLQPNRTSESFAVFGQGTYHIDDQWSMTLGFRQSEDKKEDVGGENQDCGLPPFINDPTRDFQNEDVGQPQADDLCALAEGNSPNTRSNEWSAPTWRVQADYKQADNMFFYGSIATGYKAGGFGDAGSPDYDEENLTNYEVGMKSDLLDGSLRLNLAAYYSDYEDFQVTAIEGSGNNDGVAAAATRNAGEASITGFEVEYTWLATADTRVSGYFAYTDAEFEDFSTHVDTAFSDPDVPLVRGGGPAWAYDATGNQLPFVSKYSAQVVVEHNFEFNDASTLRPRLAFSWRDDYFLRSANLEPGAAIHPDVSDEIRNSTLDLQDGYTMVDASLRYTSADETWSVELFGRNLTDELVAISGDSSGAGGNNTLEYTFKPPRTYGIRFDYHWN